MTGGNATGRRSSGKAVAVSALLVLVLLLVLGFLFSATFRKREHEQEHEQGRTEDIEPKDHSPQGLDNRPQRG